MFAGQSQSKSKLPTKETKILTSLAAAIPAVQLGKLVGPPQLFKVTAQVPLDFAGNVQY
jgi:hypothetical protein